MRTLIVLLIPLLTLAAPEGPRTESFWRQILRFAGISKSPGSLKGPADIETGQVWVIRLKSATLAQLTPEGGYRSPVFVPAGDAVIALHGFELVRIPVAEPDPVRLFAVSKITKLVGFDPQDPNTLLAVFEEDKIGFIDLTRQRVTFLEYDASSPDRDLVNSLKQWERTYSTKDGDQILSVKPGEQGGGFRDVYLRGPGRNVNLSRCQNFSCGQPSFSYDLKKVAFIRNLRKEP